MADEGSKEAGTRPDGTTNGREVLAALGALGLIMTRVGNYRIDRPTAGGRTGKTLHESL